MKLITLIQAGALALLALFGAAFAGAEQAQPCPTQASDVPASQTSCDL